MKSSCSIEDHYILLDSSKIYNINIDNYFIEFTPVGYEDNKIRIPICLRSYYKRVFEHSIKSSLKISEDLCVKDDEYTLMIPDTYNLRVLLRHPFGSPSKFGAIKRIELYGSHVAITWANVDQYSDGSSAPITSKVTCLEYGNIDYFYVEKYEGSYFLKIVVFE